MTCKDPDLDQVEQVAEVVGVGVEVKVVNKLAIEGGGEGEYRGCRQGGPTKLPAKGGGQQQRPGKEEPLVGWRKEGASDQRPPTMLEPWWGLFIQCGGTPRMMAGGGGWRRRTHRWPACSRR